jgi:hypothetical protein
LATPTSALAFGEIFKVETQGVEYCGNFDVTKFNTKNNVDLWIQAISETELLASFTANFAPGTTFPLFGHAYQISKTTAAFVAGVLFEDNSFVTFVGTAKFNPKTGEIQSMTGTFIQAGLLDPGCFSKGQAKTVKRLN